MNQNTAKAPTRILFVVLLACAACFLGIGSALAHNGVAEAAPYIQVDASLPNGDDLDQPVDLATVANTSATPVVGMYYKSNAWNVLVTGTASGQYATFQAVVSKALTQYNDDYGTSYTFAQIWNNASQTFNITATDGAYDKYYPTYADTTSRNYFYDLATNSDTTLTSSLRSTAYLLVNATSTSPAVYGANPNGVGAVFAWTYGSDVTGSGEIAGDAAQGAAASVSTSAQPRLIMGCEDGMTSSTAMGKRYCYDITGITLN